MGRNRKQDRFFCLRFLDSRVNVVFVKNKREKPPLSKYDYKTLVGYLAKTITKEEEVILMPSKKVNTTVDRNGKFLHLFIDERDVLVWTIEGYVHVSPEHIEKFLKEGKTPVFRYS